mmetsp:Transcript_20407/g.54637  ORF Transcript_20407/g.54637 Transcript_20407/m.54637 type:complete len:398 (-) Transcript_20407:284-1477(-)
MRGILKKKVVISAVEAEYLEPGCIPCPLASMKTCAETAISAACVPMSDDLGAATGCVIVHEGRGTPELEMAWAVCAEQAQQLADAQEKLSSPMEESWQVEAQSPANSNAESVQQLADLSIEYEKRVVDLKAENETRIQDLLAKNQHQIASLRADNEKQIGQLEAENAKQLEEIRDQSERHNFDVRAESAKQIFEIKAESEKQIADLKAELLAEKERADAAHRSLTLSRKDDMLNTAAGITRENALLKTIEELQQSAALKADEHQAEVQKAVFKMEVSERRAGKLMKRLAAVKQECETLRERECLLGVVQRVPEDESWSPRGSRLRGSSPRSSICGDEASNKAVNPQEDARAAHQALEELRMSDASTRKSSCSSSTGLDSTAMKFQNFIHLKSRYMTN